MRKTDPSKFSKIAIDLYGYGFHSLPTSETSVNTGPGSQLRYNDPQSQKDCTAMIRHFVQAPTKDVISDFMNLFLTMGMAGYPGLCRYVYVDRLIRTISTKWCSKIDSSFRSLDFRDGVPKPFIKYFPAIISQQDVTMRVHLDNVGKSDEGRTIDISPIQEEHTELFNGQRSYDPDDKLSWANFGPTRRVPFGK